MVTSIAKNQSDTFTLQQPSKRMEWLDAMRGLAMLMVIYSHQVMGSPLDYTCVTVEAFRFVMLQMFFFISGFLCAISSMPVIIKVRKLALQLLLPTVVIYLIHAWIYGDSLDLFAKMKNGFWFLPTLFVVEVVGYVLFKYIRRCSLTKKVGIICLVIIADKILTSLAFRYGMLNTPWADAFQLSFFCVYLIPFLIGALIRYVHRRIYSYVDGHILFFGIIIMLFLLLSFYNQPLIQPFLSSLGVFVIFLIMHNMRGYFRKDHHIGNFLILCGKNTLGLYLLHYFVLSEIICHFSPILLMHMGMESNPLMQLVIIGFSTLVTTVITLSAIKVIEMSPVLSLLCLGQPLRKMDSI